MICLACLVDLLHFFGLLDLLGSLDLRDLLELLDMLDMQAWFGLEGLLAGMISILIKKSHEIYRKGHLP